jgi:hypothetical protein
VEKTVNYLLNKSAKEAEKSKKKAKGGSTFSFLLGDMCAMEAAGVWYGNLEEGTAGDLGGASPVSYVGFALVLG